MSTSPIRPTRLLPDGTPLHNRLLAALPSVDYARIRKHLHMNTGVTGRTLQEHGTPVICCTASTTARLDTMTWSKSRSCRR